MGRKEGEKEKSRQEHACDEEMGVYKTAGGWRTQQEKMKIVEEREKN